MKDDKSATGTERIRAKIEQVGALSFKLMPYIDQHDMYGSVYKRLKEGGCIGIFPEGTDPLSRSGTLLPRWRLTA